MLIKQVITIFKNYPKRHFFIILFGSILLTSIGVLGNIDFSSKEKLSELTKALDINALNQEDVLYEAISTKDSVIKRNDSLYSILKRLGADSANIIHLINSKNSKLLSKIEIGDKIQLKLNDNNIIIKLLYFDDFKSGVKAELINGEYSISKFESDIEKVKVFKHVVIEDSMYMSGLREEIPDSVLMDIVYINGWDIDFTHDIRPGDSYTFIYEEVLINGEKVLNGDVLISEFNNQEKKYIAIRFDLDNGNSEYFSTEGENVKKAFLRSPVKLSYISSKYNLRRKHPVLHTIRSHNGVDYAANRGSPVRATGDGTVSFAQYNGGCGNEIKIKHSEDYTTRYCHLDKFNSRSKVGRKVKQGQTIGYVGSTGLATGPHLHYEFHVNGKHTDPLRVKFPNADPINPSLKFKYLEIANNLIDELKNYKTITLKDFEVKKEAPSG